jgi:hypothetical protein
MKAIRSIPLAVVLFAIVGVVSAIAYGMEPGANNQAEKIYAMTYPLSDLPVYRLGPGSSGFDPSVLIALIKKSVAPESWTETDAAIAAYPKNLSCVITQTAANHARLADFFKSLRPGTDADER